MKKIVLIAVVVLVVVGMAAGVVAGAVSQYRIHRTPIEEVDVHARLDEPVPVKYDLRVVVPGNIGCARPWLYGSVRVGNKVFVWILTIRNINIACPYAQLYETRTIPLGSCFTPGEKYTVVVNDVVKTFVAIGGGSDEEL